jgi:poly-gamma-glutamate synthesis protein (capsule biosynthesis protein)
MLFSRLLPTGVVALLATLVAAPGFADDYEKLAEGVLALEVAAFGSSQGVCRYETRNGRVAISRVTVATAGRAAPNRIDCGDFDRTNASAWVETIGAYELLNKALDERLRVKVAPAESDKILGLLHNAGLAFACAHMRVGLKRREEVDAPLARAEELARSIGKETLRQWLRARRDVVEQFTAAPNTAAAPDTAIECQPKGVATPIPDATWRTMQGKSWQPGLRCPAREELALLRMPYVDFNGTPQAGEMIVAKSVAGDVLDVFAELHRSRFPIAAMQLVDKFDGNDDRSMASNNTSAFNCRPVTGGQSLSEHAYGKAIDINPVQNPYVARSGTRPPAGVPYDSAAKRAAERPGVIRDGDAVIKAFARINWKWGGGWASPKDYQHFSQSGR